MHIGMTSGDYKETDGSKLLPSANKQPTHRSSHYIAPFHVMVYSIQQQCDSLCKTCHFQLCYYMYTIYSTVELANHTQFSLN